MCDFTEMNPYIAALRELRYMRRHVDQVMAERFPMPATVGALPLPLSVTAEAGALFEEAA